MLCTDEGRTDVQQTTTSGSTNPCKVPPEFNIALRHRALSSDKRCRCAAIFHWRFKRKENARIDHLESPVSFRSSCLWSGIFVLHFARRLLRFMRVRCLQVCGILPIFVSLISGFSSAMISPKFYITVGSKQVFWFGPWIFAIFLRLLRDSFALLTSGHILPTDGSYNSGLLCLAIKWSVFFYSCVERTTLGTKSTEQVLYF